MKNRLSAVIAASVCATVAMFGLGSTAALAADTDQVVNSVGVSDAEGVAGHNWESDGPNTERRGHEWQRVGQDWERRGHEWHRNGQDWERVGQDWERVGDLGPRLRSGQDWE